MVKKPDSEKVIFFGLTFWISLVSLFPEHVQTLNSGCQTENLFHYLFWIYPISHCPSRLDSQCLQHRPHLQYLYQYDPDCCREDSAPHLQNEISGGQRWEHSWQISVICFWNYSHSSITLYLSEKFYFFLTTSWVVWYLVLETGVLPPTVFRLWLLPCCKTIYQNYIINKWNIMDTTCALWTFCI